MAVLPLRWRDDRGQGAVEYLGTLAVAAVVATTVAAAVLANAPGIGTNASRLICAVLTAGQGGCGGGATELADRQPVTPCLVAGSGDAINANLRFGFVSVEGNRAFSWEERSDGTYLVRQLSGGNASATAGIGARVAFVVADTEVGAGLSARVTGGVAFQSGNEWQVGSAAERDRLIAAESTQRFDAVASQANPLIPALRRLLGIGEEFPAPARTFIAAGAATDANAYAGAGVGVATAAGVASRVLGVSRENDGSGRVTTYYETRTQARAIAGAVGDGQNYGAELQGEVVTLTAVTRDGSGNVVRATRSALAAGESAGLTNALFGGPVATGTSQSLTTGTQYEAVLDVRSDADREAVSSLLLASGIDAAALGLPSIARAVGAPALDPLSEPFMAAVRDRGALTRSQVDATVSIPFAVNASVALGAVTGVEGGYVLNNQTFSNPEYYDGTRFAPRTNC